MPIEFVCEGCSNNLRVPDEYAGKQAKCPSCGHVNTIPAVSAPEPPIKIDEDSSSNPFAKEEMAANPYSPSAAPRSPMPVHANSNVYPFKPLYDSVFFIKFAAWYNIITGALACISIVGIIYGWLPIWIGVCLKNAARDIEIGYPNNDPGLLHSASSNLATVAKIAGVLMMIAVAFLALYLLILIFAVFIGILSNVG